MIYDAVIMDCMIACYRNWFNCCQLMTRAGIHTGLEYGFVKALLFVRRERYPAPLYLAWDGAPARGTAIFPGYKANRVHHHDGVEPPWEPRITNIRETLKDLTFSFYHPHQEADELIASFVHQQESQGKRTLIISTDGDMYQLISDLTHQSPDSDTILTPENVMEKWGVTPDKVPFYRAISGDVSDEIKGVPRIQQAVKSRLAMEATSLDHLIELFYSAPYITPKQREKLLQSTDLVRRNFQIMNLRDFHDSIPLLATPSGDTSKALEMCRQMEFDSLLDRKEWELFKLPETTNGTSTIIHDG